MQNADRKFSGTKQDYVTISQQDIDDLVRGKPVHLRFGTWSDMTPAFSGLRLAPSPHKEVEDEQQ